MESTLTSSRRGEAIDYDALGRRIATEPRWFHETFCDVKDIHQRSGLVPFVYNLAQGDYYQRIWSQPGRRDIVGKARKWGFTTLRVALGSHGVMYVPGRIFRIVAHRAQTSEEINHTVKLLYRSARRNMERLGLDPDALLPALKYDNRREYFFPSIESAVIVDTARGAGVGQSDRSDDLYITEYSEWLDAEDKRAALVGSMPPDGRATIDFNAKGIGNDAYVQYQAAKRTGADDWNGYEPVFYGVLDCPDVYTAEQLEQAKRELGNRYFAVYPSNDDEMWLLDENAVFDWDDLQKSKAPYLVDFLTDKLGSETKAWAQIRTLECFHGVDTAPGRIGGEGDFQVMKSRALFEGILWEICEPVRSRDVPEDVFAGECYERWQDLGGTMAVESNMGQAVLIYFKNRGVPANGTLYRTRDPLNPKTSKPGFTMSATSKRTAVRDYQSLLREGVLHTGSENGIHEARIYEWKDSAREIAGAPDMKDAHDDEIVADMICIQAFKRTPPPATAQYRD